MKFYDLATEQASLGSQLLSADAVISTIENVETEDYYKKDNQIIYKNIQEMFRAGTGIDLVTMTVHLQEKNLLEKIGGVTYLTHLIESVPTPENIEHYNNIIKTKSRQRKTLIIINDIKDNKLSLEDSVQKIEELAEQSDIKEESLKDIFANTLKMSTRGTEHKFNIDSLNHYLGGVDKSEVITVGGFTSQGKSDTLIQLAIDFVAEGKKVLFTSGEMTVYEVGRRILSNSYKKNIMDFRKGAFEENEKEEMEKIGNITGDNWQLNIKKIASLDDIIKHVRKYKPQILFIDYLQNLGTENDYKEITHNMMRIQTLALKEEITIFVASQLSRGNDKEVRRRPRLTDLRGSGRIEELSNIVMLLYWEDRAKERVKDRKGGEPPEQLEISIAKNRAGTIGRMMLNFFPEYCRIEEQAREIYRGGDE